MEISVNEPEELEKSIAHDARLKDGLAFLFGRETVELAAQIDIADLNLNDRMTDAITSGVRRLKELKHDPVAQHGFIEGMDQGARLVLCMWLMDMELLDRIRE